jgi:glycosyltransferase involved in cell wall biosynthesis
LKEGGPSVALPLIARSLHARGIEVEIATTDDDGPGARLPPASRTTAEYNRTPVHYFPKQTEFYKVSLPLRNWVRQRAGDYDLVHIHALFSHACVVAARAARRARVPYIIRPLGVLNRWGMQNRRRWLKALSFRWVDRPILRHAAAMHYTARAEQVEAEQSGATAHAALVPLGIDAAQFAALPGPESFWQEHPQAKGRDVILFLSRVHPKKGFDLLLPAFARVRARLPRSLLVVAGSGDPTYEQSLRTEAAQLEIADDVLWAGFLDGSAKLAAFAAAAVFTLPSYSENFGIALVEALAAGLPCVTTDAVAVCDDVREYEAGLVVPCETAALAAALERVLGDAALRARLGANARRLVAERFSLEAMGAALERLYERVLTEAAKT